MSNKVLASLESQDGTQCVDFFIRDDGSFCFEQCGAAARVHGFAARAMAALGER